jgi:hypothetical protein
MALARFEEDRPAWWKLGQVTIELFALWSGGAWFDPIAQMPLRVAWRRLWPREGR